MEKIKRGKKRPKKYRKKKQSVEEAKTVISPKFSDGMTNWLQLQKVATTFTRSLAFVSRALFILLPSFLHTAIPQSFRQVLSFLNLSFKKELEAEKAAHPPKKPRHQDLFKTNSYKKKKVLPKLDFNERIDAILEHQNKSKISESEMSANGGEELDTRNGVRLTKTLAMDCEMVGTGPTGDDSILARVSIVNAYGECVYDEYVKPREEVTDYRTQFSGIRASDLINGKDIFEVQKEVIDIIEGRKIVGHGLKNDFNVLYIDHPKSMIRDTSRYKKFKELSGNRTPSLKNLAHMMLGVDIQDGEHNSIEDAQAAMLLYLKVKKDWEQSVKKDTRKKRHK